MGLTTSLSHALSGLAAAQDNLGVVSRNVSNAGTPGYHRQSLEIVDRNAGSSTYVGAGKVTRAFSETLQTNYNQQVSQSGYASIIATYLDRLQTYLGKPGDSGSLDTVYGTFSNALSALSASPDDYATRASFMTAAQALVGTLNGLSSSVQGMRADTESQLASDVSDLNAALGTLADVNSKLSVLGDDGATRATLMDQRDRLVAQVASLVDVRVDYRADGTVALATRSGVGLLDVKPATIAFQPIGAVTASGQFDPDPSKSGVGRLTLTTTSGLTMDLVQSNVIQGGEIGGLLALRDHVLVDAQSQLDEIAAGLAQAFSTNTTEGTPATSGAATGFSLDIAGIRDGNDFVLDYTEGGVARSVRVVRVDDGQKLPLSYADPDGQLVLGLDFSAGAASVASQLENILGPNVKFSAAGTSLTVLDDGAAGLVDIGGLRARTTSTATQGAGLGLSYFVDGGNGDFTNSLSGDTQKTGFAARIAINPSVTANSALLVQATAGGPMGDASRVDHFVANLASMRFSAAQTRTLAVPAGGLNGTVSDLIDQTINYQGNTVANAIANSDSQKIALTTLQQRMDKTYAVDIDDEMSRLIQLQNAYSANARVMSVIQTLLDTLMRA